MTCNFKSESNIMNLTNEFSKKYGFQSDELTFIKCKNLITNMVNDYSEENNESIEELNNKILEKSYEKYKNGLKYFNDIAKNSEFFSDINISKLVNQFMENLNLKKNDETLLICKTFIKIYMNIIYIQNISEEDENNITELNKKTLEECKKVYTQQLNEINKS